MRAEVEINVRRIVAFERQEALEIEIVNERIDVVDAKEYATTEDEAEPRGEIGTFCSRAYTTLK
jgi:hypothetical protein